MATPSMTASELVTIMVQNGLSIRGLAAELAVAPSTVKRWRSGKLPIRVVYIRAIRDVARTRSSL